MAYIIKGFLDTTETQFFKNTEDAPPNSNLYATNIVLTNVTAVDATASLSFYNVGETYPETFDVGCVLFEADILAGKSITVGERYIAMDDIVAAKASVASSIVMSMDIVGVDDRYKQPLP